MTFPDLDGVSSATVRVMDAVSPASVAFAAVKTAYTFDSASGTARIDIPGDVFAPFGNVTFKVPVKLGAATVTNRANRVLAFNAPFGQFVDSSSGSCTNTICIESAATLSVAPGTDKTQTLNALNATGSSSGAATFRAGEGTVVVTGAVNGCAVDIKAGGIFEVGSPSAAMQNGNGWKVAANAALRIRKGCSLKLSSLQLDQNAALSLPAASSAPLTVNGTVNLANVRVFLTDAGNLSSGAKYPLVSATNFEGVKSLSSKDMPKLVKGLEWKMMIESGVLTASIVGEPDYGDEPYYPNAPETPATVDVLVAYDRGAQAYLAGRNKTLAAFAAAQIQKMNDVLATNKLERFYTYRLAGVCRVDGTYGNIDTAPATAAEGTGAMVALRAAREMYGADTVTLLVDTSGATLGNSSPLSSAQNVASQHECAFSVCSISAVDTGKQHTMIHENAHNMGCGHAREQANVNSPFSYGRGYYFKDGNDTRHTIMAYGGDNDASWYFSTSSDRFGFKLGDENNDNARVLRETCAEVAKWREKGAAVFDGDFASGDAVWQTCRKYPWSADGGTIRSFNQKSYSLQCTTPLKAVVTGPARLKFAHRSYFGGRSVAGNNYSHFDILLDDSPVLAQTECTNSWTGATVEIPAGSHEVTFVFSQRYAMNNPKDNKDFAPEDDDAVWLKDVRVVAKPVKTDGNFVVPGTDGWVAIDFSAAEEWLAGQDFHEGEGGKSWQEFMAERGANGCWNWQNFLLGCSAVDAEEKFEAAIEAGNGKVVVRTNERVPGGFTLEKLLRSKDTAAGEWKTTVKMEGASVTLPASSPSGFYQVTVECVE